jgi:putative Mg2+ transporter-C (MgtC) family protein
MMFWRLAITAVLAALIGLEREVHGSIAGLRTHILVGIGSCLIMITSMHVFELYAGRTSVDPARIAAQVVSGVGFLGAGTILRFKASVKGLTTAASVWATAGIGLAVGIGLYRAAFFTTLVILMSLIFLSTVEKRLVRQRRHRQLVLTTKSLDGAQLMSIKKTLGEYDAEIKDFEITHDKSHGMATLKFDVRLTEHKHKELLIGMLDKISGVEKVYWKEIE